MKKALFSVLAFAALLCSCQNNSLDVNAPAGRKVTITATIPSSDTKVTYTENMTDAGLALKAAWSENDVISVIAFDSNNDILSVDNLTCEGAAGKTSAVFTGELSDEASDAAVLIAVYPEIHDWTVSDNHTVALEGSVGIYFSVCDNPSDDTNDLERIAKSAAMMGKVSATDSDEFNVTLEHQHALIRFDLKFSDDISDPDTYIGQPCTEILLVHLEPSFNEIPMPYIMKYNPISDEKSYSAAAILTLHADGADCKHAIKEDGTLSFYQLVFPQELKEGEIFWVECKSDNGNQKYNVVSLINIGSDVTLEAGKVYTVSGPLKIALN